MSISSKRAGRSPIQGTIVHLVDRELHAALLHDPQVGEEFTIIREIRRRRREREQGR